MKNKVKIKKVEVDVFTSKCSNCGVEISGRSLALHDANFKQHMKTHDNNLKGGRRT